MKIYRKSFPLPFGDVPTEVGELKVDEVLDEYTIQELDEKYGFRKSLGSGMFGVAYVTFDNRVVKITTDAHEFELTKTLIGDYWQVNAPFARVYEAEQISENLYVIVKELLKPLSEEEQSLFMDFMYEFEGLTEKVAEEYQKYMPMFEKFEEYYFNVTNYPFQDVLNPGNVGWDNEGKLKAFDPRAIALTAKNKLKIERYAVKGLDISKDISRSKKEHAQQERALKKYVKIIPGLVEKICQKGKEIYEDIKLSIPGRNDGSVLRQRRKVWMQRVEEIEGLAEFCSHIAGEDNVKKVLRLICDVSSGQMLLRDGKKRLIGWATNLFKHTETESKQLSQFEGSGYEKELLNLLPPQVYFELGPNRELIAIKESFGREQKNWDIMSKKVAYIAKHFNGMVQEIKNDLKSGDEATRLLALMMAITIETGLRPGAVGNAATVVDPTTGEKIEIDTFGVTTLQVQHVKIIREGFAELQFAGKKGTIQIARLTDNDVVSLLKQILSTMSLQGSTSMIFVTKSGQHIDDAQMRNYVQGKWKDISPTDFRKYVATRSFYNYVKQATDEFRMKLLDEIANGKEILKDTIVNEVIGIINQAIEATKQTLSHKEGHDAWKTYVSPKVIMAYLANGGLDDTLEDILIDNKNVRFSFDFNEFVKFADGLR